MDRLEEMRVFVRIVERRSFTQAAEDLQLPRATVTNAIQRLETRLGARLLERTTRQVSPTLDGDSYYQRCLRLLADMEEAEESFRNTTPKGLLRVNLQGALARNFVIPALPAFLQRYPGIELHIGEGDRLVDLVREGVDCVLRAGTLQDSSMVGRRVANLEQITCASPAYLAQFGLPADLKALARHRAVNYLSTATGRALPLEFMVDGKLQTLNLPGSVSVTGADVYTASAIAGLGLVQVPRYRVHSQLEDGSLQIVLPELPPPTMPVSVLYPQSRQLSARVRLFADWLQALFASSNP
ncbi:LysR family transcriptional regulator [Rhodoferax sp.]|uniref:LysR family transcriptional regulator n=1 Tax=Rhodoferax sp. TaxID=50421 RepID=UPI00374DEAD2